MYSRYLDYTQSATKAHNAAIIDNDKKDAVISTLKNDLYELRQLESDYLRLNDQITTLEDRYSLLIDEKDRSEKEQRTKTEIDKNTILQLRQEIDTLRSHSQRVAVQIEEALRENTALKRMSDARSNQIQNIISNNRDLEGKNQRQNDQNRNTSFNVKAFKQERKKLEDDCDALSHLLDQNIAKLKGLERNARNGQSNNARLGKTLLQAENDNSKLNKELSQGTEQVRRSEIKLKDTADNIDDLQITYQSLETACNKSKSEAANNQTAWQNQVSKGKQLLGKLEVVESAINSREDELDTLGREEDRLRKQHFQKLDHNKSLNAEIDRLLAIIAEYEQVNKQLIEQIEIYIDQDEQARTVLNRSDGMRELINRTIAKVQATNEPIKHLKY